MAENIYCENCNTGPFGKFPFGFSVGYMFYIDIGFVWMCGACECVLAKTKLLHDQLCLASKAAARAFVSCRTRCRCFRTDFSLHAFEIDCISFVEHVYQSNITSSSTGCRFT